jgi:DNA repair exonuclease SbcCD ATPase subunit
MDCPICETSNIPESKNCCPTCGYDLSLDPTEQQRIVAWAKKLWADSRAKTDQAKPASTQSRYQINHIVSQVEQLTQAQTQLCNQLAEFASANMSARFTDIEQRLEDIVDYRLDSAKMSARFSEIEERLEQRLEEIVDYRLDSAKMSARFLEIEQGIKQQLETIVSSRLASLDNMSARFSEIEQQLEERIEDIVSSQLADLSATIEQQIIDKLKESLSQELSTAVSQLEQRLDSLPSAPDTGISLKTLSFTTVKVNDEGEIKIKERAQAEYFWQDIGNGVTLDMVAIPGGTFTMGSPETEKGRD